MDTRLAPIDISHPLKELCDLLDLEYSNVARLEITPSELVATTYLINEQGSKYLRRDTWEPAVETTEFPVAT